MRRDVKVKLGRKSDEGKACNGERVAGVMRIYVQTSPACSSSDGNYRGLEPMTAPLLYAVAELLCAVLARRVSAYEWYIWLMFSSTSCPLLMLELL
jgi:hypothetical protein